MRAWPWIVGGVVAGIALYVVTRSVQRGGVSEGFSAISEDIVSVAQKIRELIEYEEGLRLEVYRDPGAGAWTIGYGHLVKPGEPYHPYGPIQTITREEAERLLDQDTRTAQDAVANYVSVPLSDNQRATLVSFVFNVGTTAFRESTLLKKLNAGDYHGAAAELDRWVYDDGKVVPILIARRAREKELFLSA